MQLKELVTRANLLIMEQNQGNPEITDICYDSRKVVPGCLYVSIPGINVHGDSFIPDAIARGAYAILSENPHHDLLVPWIQTKNTRAALGLLGKALWNAEVDNITAVGVTGTNGKTTVTHLFQKLFEEQFSKEYVWMFGTVGNSLGKSKNAASHTTPESVDIFRSIANARQKPNALVMEVSSHSLFLDRICGLQFDIAVWTNLTQDHLDFHVTMESYYQAKKRLFTNNLKKNGTAVINIDDKWGMRLAGEINDKRIMTYGRSSSADVRICSSRCDWDGCLFEISSNEESFEIKSSLRGDFNLYNLAAMVTGAIALELSTEKIHSACKSIQTVPGRMERVAIDAPFSVIVDYAHTPDALVNVLKTARKLTQGKLLCVFGCGGDRDRTKRPLMGAEVAQNCDEAIVTSDNPRSENPQTIINDILPGIPLDFPHITIADRKEAISKALKMAAPGDCIVIAGKGHEDYQEIKGVRYHFNDREVVLELFENMRNLK
ncbi:MAG: UDP-N-acetylmuramoyl-L-alanyl-D-glutamate--2,6-diaminopimelate ligase [Fibrobacter sp.]|nr:UDP-N-acetylmuramoyl-L-alanyl-D-glutamate--2,6-diaminopimelate ligase [Fibrobacter sp.]